MLNSFADWSNTATGPSSRTSPASFLPPTLEGQRSNNLTQSSSTCIPALEGRRSNVLPSPGAFTVVPRVTTSKTPNLPITSGYVGRHSSGGYNALQHNRSLGLQNYSLDNSGFNDFEGLSDGSVPTAAVLHGNRLNISSGGKTRSNSAFVPRSETDQESHSNRPKRKRQKQKLSSASKPSKTSKQSTPVRKKPRTRTRSTATPSSSGAVAKNVSFLYPGFSSDWSSAEDEGPPKKKSKTATSNSQTESTEALQPDEKQVKKANKQPGSNKDHEHTPSKSRRASKSLTPPNDSSAGENSQVSVNNEVPVKVSAPTSLEKSNHNPSNGDSGFLSSTRDESVCGNEHSSAAGAEASTSTDKAETLVTPLKHSPNSTDAACPDSHSQPAGNSESVALDSRLHALPSSGDPTIHNAEDCDLTCIEESQDKSVCEKSGSRVTSPVVPENSSHSDNTNAPSQHSPSCAIVANTEGDDSAVLALDSVPLDLASTEDLVSGNEEDTELTHIEESQNLTFAREESRSRSTSPVIPMQTVTLLTEDQSLPLSVATATINSGCEDQDSSRVETSMNSTEPTSSADAQQNVSSEGPQLLHSLKASIYDYASDMSTSTDCGGRKMSSRKLKLLQRVKQSMKYPSVSADDTPTPKKSTGVASVEGKTPIRQYRLSHLKAPSSLSPARFRRKRFKPVITPRNKSQILQSGTKTVLNSDSAIQNEGIEILNDSQSVTEEADPSCAHQSDSLASTQDPDTEGGSTVRQDNVHDETGSDKDSSPDIPVNQKSFLTDPQTQSLPSAIAQPSSTITTVTTFTPAVGTNTPHHSTKLPTSDSDSESEDVQKPPNKKPPSVEQSKTSDAAFSSSWSSASDSELPSKKGSKPSLLPKFSPNFKSSSPFKKAPSVKSSSSLKGGVKAIKESRSTVSVKKRDISSDSDSSDTEVDTVKSAARVNSSHKRAKPSESSSDSSSNEETTSSQPQSTRNLIVKKPSLTGCAEKSASPQLQNRLKPVVLSQAVESKKPTQRAPSLSVEPKVTNTPVHTKPQPASKFLFTTRSRVGSKSAALSSLANESKGSENTESSSGKCYGSQPTALFCSIHLLLSNCRILLRLRH